MKTHMLGVTLEVKNPPANAGHARDVGLIPGLGRPPEWEMATHSGILAWKIQWADDPGGLQAWWGDKESDMTDHTRTLHMLDTNNV